MRQDVFVLEQACPFLDIDGLDANCHHVCAFEGLELQAYARILPPELKYDEASIGRIVVAREKRSLGLGKKLMDFVISETEKLYPKMNIRMSAQLYLESYYQKFGFKRISEIYLDDGIPHVDMIFPNR